MYEVPCTPPGQAQGLSAGTADSPASASSARLTALLVVFTEERLTLLEGAQENHPKHNLCLDFD